MNTYKRIIIGSDHGGFETKEFLKKNLEKDFEIIDVGTNSTNSCDYPDIASLLCKKIQKDKEALGIIICGTGIGMSIAANKFKKIRCANVINVEFAKLAKAHNHANVLSLSGRFVSNKDNLKIIQEFLKQEPEARHIIRLKKIKGNGNGCIC